MRGSVIVLTGPPGAGKSTTARALAESFDKAVHLHTDDFWHYIVAGMIPPYLPESHEQNQTVVRVIANAAYGYAEGGFTVVVDGIVGPWMLDHYREGLEEHPGLPVHYVVLRPDREETLRRAQGRNGPDALVAEEPVLCSGTSSRTWTSWRVTSSTPATTRPRTRFGRWRTPWRAETSCCRPWSRPPG